MITGTNIPSRPLAVGDWAVVGKIDSWTDRMTFEAAQVEKLTAKLAYANAHYRKQHSIENVVAMPNEESARLFVERAKSAYAEAGRCQNAAWERYRETIAKMLLAAQVSA